MRSGKEGTRFGRMRRNPERGFYLIGLLMVVVIIMILSGRNFQSASGSGQGSAADSAASLFTDPLAIGAGQVQMGNARIDGTKALSCDTNRSQFATDLTMLAMSHSGQLPQPSVVSNRLGHFGCPTTGKFQYDDGSHVFCTEHAPAPPSANVHNL
jgi:Tfp pilus assembly protein PilE